ncbi:hypothetical protein WJX74_009104 [Apatococcus lobatus]|uniref:F-box domain-containing protein n=1 Tax=Apatococcus lobatus TaxID=904363 RepID=A0AAW1Q5Y0_9CHLO
MAVHPEPKSLFGKDVKGALLRGSARLQVDQQEDLLARMRCIVGPHASRDLLLRALCSSQGRLGFAVNIYFREVVMRLGAEPPDWQWNPRRPSGNSGVTRAPALSALMGSTAGQLPQSSRNDGCSAKQSDQQKQCGRCLDLHGGLDHNSQGGNDKQSQVQRDACSPAQLRRDPQLSSQIPGMPPKIHLISAPEMEVTLPSQHPPSQSCCQMEGSGASVGQAETMRAQHVPQQQPSKQDSQTAGCLTAIGLADLPQEVLEVILGHAGARATCQAASTCKALCQAAVSDEIWRCHTARRIVPIVYGFPSSPLLKAGKEKRAINGGDYLIASEPVWACNSCRARFTAFPFQDVLD